MYSVVEIAGHQYKVKAGDVIDVEKLEQEVGDMIELDKVLFTAGDKPQVGLPVVAGAKVKAKVIRMAKDRKVVVYKRKPSHRDVKKGHRQNYTALLITEIDNGHGDVSKIDSSSKEAQKHLK